MSTLALLFPGQGSQTVGMYADFYEEFGCVRDTFAEASDAIGLDIYKLIQDGPADELNRTENTQPALLTCSIAAFRAASELGLPQASFHAGHSLGEWSALVASQVVAFADAVRLVKRRGQYMQEAVPEGKGAMAAIIGLDDESIEAICAAKSSGAEIVSPVNYNSPGQLVIAGTKAAVENAVAACSDKGAKRALMLPVSAPFHTSLMRPAADRLAEDMQAVSFRDPLVPIVHNVHANTETDGAAIRDLMIQQIYSPVRWVDCVTALADKGVEAAAECGPGKVLSGLVKRIDKSINCHAFTTATALREGVASHQDQE